MLFPERMHRVVWLLPEQRLAKALVLLARFGAFHTAEHSHLPQRFELKPLLEGYQAHRRSLLAVRAWRLLTKIPAAGMLNYAAGLLPVAEIDAGRKAGAWVD